MYEPRPHGKFGEAATDEDAAAAELLVRRLTNFKTASGLNSLKMTRTLPSGAMAIAVDMGGVLRVIIQPPLAEPSQPTASDGLAKNYIPMLFSGCIVQGVVAPGAGVEIQISETTRRRLVSYDPKVQTAPARVRLQKFVVDHNERVAELKPKIASAFTWTQYVNQRPSWYSGAMAEVMQIVGGYGRQVLAELPDNKIERARVILPTEVAKKIDLQLGNTRLPGYLGLPDKTGQFQFDYKFNETNGVGFDSDSKPWLLRVNTRGVYAMPMPLIPATTTPAFRDYMEEVNDAEIIWILDRFGGMPSGESFPTSSSDFESWRRAGVIIKVCDTGEFYDHLAYSSAVGWSFNKSGTEGYNTCYDYEEDGIGYGLAFKLQLRLGPALNDGKLQVEFDLDDPFEMQRLNAYLSKLYQQISGKTARELAIKYKLRRIPVADLLDRAEGDSEAAKEIEFWENFEAPPIASHTGNVTRVAKGNLWNGAKFLSQPQIKFPEPFITGCLSHDFSALENGVVPSGYIVRCDTIMFGYYVGDELNVVKYFLDSRAYAQEVENNYEECMIVGAWEQTVHGGYTSLIGHFYTSSIDEREAGSSHTTVTTTVGKDLGYDTKGFFSYDEFFSRNGSLWRHRYFQHKVNTTSTEDYTKSIAVCVPYFARNALLHAVRESTSGASKSEALSVYAVLDPNQYRYFTYDFVWAWAGGNGLYGNVAFQPNVSPIPIGDGTPVWVVGHNNYPSLCSDFADQGDWVGGVPQDYTWLIHPNKSEWHHSGGGGPPTVKEYYRAEIEKSKSEGVLQISFTATLEIVNKDPGYSYFMASPNQFGDIFYVDAIRNEAGDSIYSSLSEPEPESLSHRKRFGFTRFADHKSAHHFIGVINE